MLWPNTSTVAGKLNAYSSTNVLADGRGPGMALIKPSASATRTSYRKTRPAGLKPKTARHQRTARRLYRSCPRSTNRTFPRGHQCTLRSSSGAAAAVHTTKCVGIYFWKIVRTKARGRAKKNEIGGLNPVLRAVNMRGRRDRRDRSG